MILDSMIKIVMISIISVIFILILKPNNSHIALMLTLLTSVVLFLFITPFLEEVVSLVKSFQTYIDFKNLYLDVVLKIICVSYICEIGVDLCKDAGISSIATKIEMGGKVLIMILSLPIIQEVLKTVITIL